MKTQRVVLFLFATAFVVPGHLEPLLAAEESLADVTLGTADIQWRATADFDTLWLRISGPGGIILDQEASDGNAIELDISSLGEPVVDGSYNWEIRALPRLSATQKRVLEDLRSAREAGQSPSVESLREAGSLPQGLPLQSGQFTVLNGAVVVPGRQEAGPAPRVLQRQDPGAGSWQSPQPSQRDYVFFSDDLIVRGNACIGEDCEEEETFDLDTLRLKEDILRIELLDTSTTAGFPTTDWQLSANDSEDGGASRFSIDDIDSGRTPFTIEANARHHSLYIDDGGRVGFRTSTPSVELHTVDGDTPTLRLEQDGSSGFAPQTWDVAGNETNFFIRDVTNGSTLPLRVRPGAPTSSVFIDVDGDVGVGTASPSHELHITRNGSETVAVALEQTGAGAPATWRLTYDPIGSVAAGTGADAMPGSFAILEEGHADAAPFRIARDAANDLLILNQDGVVITGPDAPSCAALKVNGAIYQRGSELHADYVFEPHYQLPTIAEQGRLMTEQGHLPAVPAARLDVDGQQVVDIGAQRRGILEELEKAHLYIQELHASLARVTAANDDLARRLADLESDVGGTK